VKRGDSVEEVKNKCPACHLVHVETIGSATEDRSTSKVCPTSKSLVSANLISFGQVSLERYRKASVKVMTIFARFCPKVERASIDEGPQLRTTFV
jgi:nucleotidyltransferase/DNA polymerase involved in DNA repair